MTSLTLYFIGYVLFEVSQPHIPTFSSTSRKLTSPQIPCNVILKRTTPKIWLPTLTLVWGVVATLMGITQNLAGFFAVRFFLGVAESGLFPGVVFYLSMWYKRTERVYRVALFFSAASLAGAFGGILAYVSCPSSPLPHVSGVRRRKKKRQATEEQLGYSKEKTTS